MIRLKLIVKKKRIYRYFMSIINFKLIYNFRLKINLNTNLINRRYYDL